MCPTQKNALLQRVFFTCYYTNRATPNIPIVREYHLLYSLLHIHPIEIVAIASVYMLLLIISLDAKAGGASAPNSTMGTVVKHKMSVDEACKILNIEKSNLNKATVNEVS